jgi:hypothetical protein
MNDAISRPGAWFPQHILTYRGESRPSDAWVSPSFYLVGYHGNPEKLLDTTTLSRWTALGGRFMTITDHRTADAYFDQDNEYAAYFRSKTIAVLRPDRIVTVLCSEIDLNKQLNRYLQGICTHGEGTDTLPEHLTEAT